MRLINVIASEIENDWVKVNYAARPYLDAMKELYTINDAYYLDSADGIVSRFLANAGSWRGDVARKVKQELKDMLNGA